jgi:hypothetical protein
MTEGNKRSLHTSVGPTEKQNLRILKIELRITFTLHPRTNIVSAHSEVPKEEQVILLETFAII